MTIKLTREIAEVLAEHSRQRSVSAEQLALDALRERFLDAANKTARPPQSQAPPDAWEEKLLSIGFTTGMALSDEDTRREHLYEDAA